MDLYDHLGVYMTKKLFDTDSHLLAFDARVLACDGCEGGYWVLLDATAFAPEGGGQPSDLGMLGGMKVLDVREREGEIWLVVSFVFPPCKFLLEMKIALHSITGIKGFDWTFKVIIYD